MRTSGIVSAGCVAAMLSSSVRTQIARQGDKETLLQSDHGWNGSPYDRYPVGRPQLTPRVEPENGGFNMSCPRIASSVRTGNKA